MNTIAKPPSMVEENAVPSQALVPASPMGMLQIAVERGASIEILNKLVDLQERVEVNLARKAFDAAIAAAKAEMPKIPKNRDGHNGRRYVDLAGIAATIDPILSRHGLSYRFRTQRVANEIIMTCITCHRAGHYEENSLPGPVDTSGSKNPIQSIGSTCTYLQRYTLMQALGLAASEDDDDDGEAAGDGPSEKTANGNGKQKQFIPRTEFADFIKGMFSMQTESDLINHLGAYIEKMADWPVALYDDAIEKFASRLSGASPEFRELYAEAFAFRSAKKLVDWAGTLAIQGKPWYGAFKKYFGVKLGKLRDRDKQLAERAAGQWIHDTDDADPRQAVPDDFDHEADEVEQAKISERAIALRNGKR